MNAKIFTNKNHTTEIYLMGDSNGFKTSINEDEEINKSINNPNELLEQVFNVVKPPEFLATNDETKFEELPLNVAFLFFFFKSIKIFYLINFRNIFKNVLF